MAMNNWGGVTEHMSKKPRKFHTHKQVVKNISKSPQRNDSFKVSKLAKKEMAQNEAKTYYIYLVLIILGTIAFLFFSGTF